MGFSITRCGTGVVQSFDLKLVPAERGLKWDTERIAQTKIE